MSDSTDTVTDDEAGAEASAELSALKPAPGIGFFPDIPEDDYHAMEGVSQSTLKRFLEAPAKVGIPMKETRSMALGSLLHYVMTQGELVDQRYYVAPGLERISKREKKYKEAVEVAGPNRTVITPAMFEKALRIRDAVMKQPIGKTLFGGPMEIEQSFFWTDPVTGLLCRGRTDVFRPDWNVVIDLKSTKSAAYDDCGKSIANFGYDIQDPYYLDGWEFAGRQGVVKRPRPNAFFFLFIETDAPHLSQALEIPAEDRQRGADEYRDALNKYAFCKAQNLFPGYGNDVTTATLPGWTAESRARRAASCDNMIATAIRERDAAALAAKAEQAQEEYDEDQARLRRMKELAA